MPRHSRNHGLDLSSPFRPGRPTPLASFAAFEDRVVKVGGSLRLFVIDIGNRTLSLGREG
jgi:hypothetical protein